MADLLRYLRDRRVAVQEQGRWTLGQSIPDLQRELPESVRSMIQQKIDQLGEDDRRLLVAASVQGYEFDSAVVAQALARDAAEVEERLEMLDRVHAFVRLVREQEFPDQTLTLRFRFVHVLYQNALYSSLGPTRRAELSAAVAKALLSYYGQRSAEIAGDLALLLEAARDPARAASHFLQATYNAVAVFAKQEAVVLAHRGLALLQILPDTPERNQLELRLLIALGPVLMVMSGYGAPEVERTYARARALCQQVGDAPQLFSVLWGLWYLYLGRAQWQAAYELAEQLLGLAERVQDSSLLLLAHRVVGQTLSFRGEPAVARTHLDRARRTVPARSAPLPGLRLWRGSGRDLSVLGGLGTVAARLSGAGPVPEYSRPEPSAGARPPS